MMCVVCTHDDSVSFALRGQLEICVLDYTVANGSNRTWIVYDWEVPTEEAKEVICRDFHKRWASHWDVRRALDDIEDVLRVLDTNF
jgi:hypothetical protein